MLAIPEILPSLSQRLHLNQLHSRWREVPLYQSTPDHLDFFERPFITKHDLRRDFPQNFLRAGQDLPSLLALQLVEVEYTSGTSEERTQVLFGNGWWNAQEISMLRLNSLVAGVLDDFPQARRATLTPPVCNGRVCFSNWHSRSARTVENSLFVNLARIPFLLNETELARMAREISEWSPQFLDLDPIHGAWFALYCDRKSIRFPSVKFILCSYEFVSVVHRRIMDRVFGVPIFNLYGSTETGHLLMEDEHGEMKPNFENAFYEIIDPDDRGIGDLVVTTLINDYMPLVRYRIGDLAEQRTQDGAKHYVVHGRDRDTLKDLGGNRVTTFEIDACFEGISGIAHYQLRQNAHGDCHLQFIPDIVAPSAEDLCRLGERLGGLLEISTPLRTEQVSVLPPTTSGKFRLTQRD